MSHPTYKSPPVFCTKAKVAKGGGGVFAGHYSNCVFSTYHNISILLHVVWLLISPAVVCSTLTQPTNGDVNLTGTTLGQRATYTCDSGYNLVGNSTRMCQATGAWSGSEPTCSSESNYVPVIETKLQN